MLVSTPETASATRNSREIARATSSALLLFLAAVLVLCDVTISSRFYVFMFGVDSRSIFMAVALGVIFFFVIVALIGRDFVAVLVSAALLGFFLAYLTLFAAKAGREIHWNALAQTYGLLSFIVFYELSKRFLLARLLRLMLYILTAYLLAYTVVASLHYADIIDIPEPPGVFTILHDRERGQRLFMAGAFATFVWTYSLVRLTHRFHVGYLFSLLVALMASALSLSRVFLVVNAIVALTYIVTRKVRLVSLVTFALYLAIISYLLWGVVQPSFNPFDFSSSDTTILYRKHEYDVMAAMIRLEPVFGVGFYDSEQGLGAYVGRQLFFPSDIGIVGIWLVFGFIGVVVLGLIPAWLCCFPRESIHRTDVGRVDSTALALTGCCIGLYASTSMNMINGPDSMIFAVILGRWLFNVVYGSRSFHG